MNKFNDTQLALLSNLIYLDDVVKKEGKVLKNVVENLLYYKGLEKSQRLEKIGTIEEYPARMTKAQWQEILRAILQDPQLRNLTIRDGVDREKGLRAACFVDKKTNSATVVFRGTANDYQWHDNGQGAYLSDTEQQMEALIYVQNALKVDGKKLYDYVTVAGHSKGGNKSQYVTVLSGDLIDKCVSIDGQGFSNEFLEKYATEIAANRHKITSISAVNDFVNCLLNSIAGKVIYIETEKQKDFLNNHCPNILLVFNEKGEASLRAETEQGFLSKFINAYTVYAISNLEGSERSYVIDGLLAFLETGQEGIEKEGFIQKTVAVITALNVAHDFLLDQLKDKDNLIVGLMMILKMADLAKGLINSSKDIAFEVLRQMGASIIDWLDKMVHQIMVLSNKIGQGLKMLALDAKNLWNSILTSINDGIDRFIASASNFFNDLVNGIRRLTNIVVKVITDSLYKISSQANQIVNRVITTTKEEIKKKQEAFMEGSRFLANYIRQTITKLGQKAVPVIRNFTKRIIQGMSSYKVGQLTVDLIKLAELQTKMRNLERDFGDRIAQITKDTSQLISDVGRSYPEPYVQQQIQAINRQLDEIRDSNRRVCEQLHRKTKDLQSAIDSYKRIENQLIREIKD